MSEQQPKSSGGFSWVKSKVAAMAMTAVVVAVVFSLIIVVVLSPSMSPLASVHDADGDGYPDSLDEFPDDASEWRDLDGDGVGDNADAFPDDGDETSDSDGDGVGDNSDPFPDDPDEWQDSDGDGVGDNADEFPHDPDECCDTDGDGVGDNSDEYPDDPTEWSDTDGDGWGDNIDVFPEDPRESSPEVILYTELMSDYVMMEFEVVNPEFPWDDLKVAISIESEVVEWEPSGEDLDGGALITHFYSVQSLGGIDVLFTVADVSGDGLVSAMDIFGIWVMNGTFESGVVYSLNYTYEPMDCSLVDYSSSFSFDLETPTAALTKVSITDGYRFTFAALSSEVDWDDIAFLLDDGTNSVLWSNVTSDDLIGGIGTTKNYGAQYLGDLEVTLVVMDLAGNGIVNQGDYFSLTATTFSSVTDYTITVMFEPTDEPITLMSFAG